MSESAYRTFEALQIAAKLVAVEFRRSGRLRTDFRQVAEPNPLFHQLERGLCLELAPNGAVHFWTPWGDLNVMLANAFDGSVPEISGLGLGRIRPSEPPGLDCPGSRIFSIHQTSHLVLPKPQPRSITEYLPPANIQRRWTEVSGLFRLRRSSAA